MILLENKNFAIECDLDDEWSQAVGRSLAEVFGQYQLEGNKNRDPLSIDCDGIQFVIKYKRMFS